MRLSTPPHTSFAKAMVAEEIYGVQVCDLALPERLREGAAQEAMPIATQPGQ